MNPDEIKKLLASNGAYATGINTYVAGSNGMSSYDISSHNLCADVYYEYAIKGHMVECSAEIDDYELQHLTKPEIKARLAMDLAYKILNGSLVDFTQQKSAEFGRTVLRARAFAVPSTDVQILRVTKRKN